MAFELSFGGVGLTCPDDAVRAEVDRRWPGTDPAEFWRDVQVGTLQRLPLPQVSFPEVRLGSLWWPTGASRFACGRYLATKSQLDRILPTYLAAQPTAGTLLVSDGKTSLSASMYCLPPRPLFESSSGTDKLYLLTLVDRRYFWWQRGATVSAVPASWAALLQTLLSACGVSSYSSDAPHPDYGVPSDRWLHVRPPLPLMIDAAAYACGLRVVCALDGSVSLQNVCTASTVNAAQTSRVSQHSGSGVGVSRLAGGVYSQSGLAASVPNSVDVVQGQSVTNVTLASLGLTEFSGVLGFPGQKVWFGDVQPSSGSGSGVGVPSPSSACGSGSGMTYAQRAARDWYEWQLSGFDGTLSGVVNWQVNGFNDRVEWDWSERGVTTSVRRPPLNDRSWGQYLSGAQAGGGSGGGGGGSGSGGGTCPDLGWLLTFPEESINGCLTMTVLAKRGHCLCIDLNQKIKLVYDSANTRWIGSTFSTCCGCSMVEFKVVDDGTRPEVYGRFRLTKRNKECRDDTSGSGSGGGLATYHQTEYYTRNPLPGCVPSSIEFVGADTRGVKDNCDDPTNGCDHSFKVRLTCDPCPPNSCCCPGCQPATYCVENVASPQVWFVSVSGFSGSDGPLLNIDWVLYLDPNNPCGFLTQCFIKGALTVTVTWAYVDSTHGWRLTLTTPGGSAVYETGVGTFGNGKIDCCYPSGTTVSYVSSSGYTGHPATLLMLPISTGSSCSHPIVTVNDVNDCNTTAIKNRRYLATTLAGSGTTGGGGCSGLIGQTATLTWNAGGSRFDGISAGGTTIYFDPVGCSAGASKGAAGTGNPVLTGQTSCPTTLFYSCCAAPAYCGGSGIDFNCSHNPDAVRIVLTEI